MTLRLGIIGMGKFGRIRQQKFSERPDCEVTHFFDPHVAHYGGLERVKTATELLHNSDLDAVLICTPTGFSCDYVCEAIRSGKHVFCEKPPGVSLEEARQMHECQVAHRDVKVKFGFNHQLMGHYQMLREIVEEERYGPPIWVRGQYGKGFDEHFATGWRGDPQIAGGGILLDQGIHLLDMIVRLVGDVHVEHALVDHLKCTTSGIEDNVFALLRSSAGVPIFVHSSMVHWKHTLRLEVCTDQALIVLDGIKSSTRSFGDETLTYYTQWRDNFVETHTIEKNNPDYYTQTLEAEEFVSAIRTGCDVGAGSTEDAMRIMSVLHDIYAFSADGRHVGR